MANTTGITLTTTGIINAQEAIFSGNGGTPPELTVDATGGIGFFDPANDFNENDINNTTINISNSNSYWSTGRIVFDDSTSGLASINVLSSRHDGYKWICGPHGHGFWSRV